MFESDDFDQVLSQIDFPESDPKTQSENDRAKCNNNQASNIFNTVGALQLEPVEKNCDDKSQGSQFRAKHGLNEINKTNEYSIQKCVKRHIINSHFDHKNKRKFPGPAGLLSGTLQETDDENISHIELLSQDIDYSQSHGHRDLFEMPLWKRLRNDVITWKLGDIDTIKAIKQQAMNGNLRQRKAETVVGVVVTVDRSVTDPLITLKDTTGYMKCTLHRDAWSNFSPYIVSDYCALVLWKPTVLTTGSTFKKHYLNITLNNIYALYSSTVLNQSDDKKLSDGYVKICEENLTIIKTENNLQISNSAPSTNVVNKEPMADSNDLLDGLDDSIFSENIF